MNQSLKWRLKKAIPHNISDNISQHPKLLAQLLFNRGFSALEKIDEFFNSDYILSLGDPMKIKNMDRAVARTIEAIGNKEKIVVYGDYDADGICATSIVYKFLKEAGIDCDVYIPDRFKEGYGLNLDSVSAIIKKGTKLIITVDCGITDFKEIELCNQNKVDVIILDHHLPLGDMPKAYAIVDLKQEGETYSFTDFCGAGLAFKFVCALFKMPYFKERVKEGFEKWLLDLASLATIADMVPLRGENRTIVKYGLMVMLKTRWAGLSALLKKTGLDKKNRLTGGDVAFRMAPRINAASRMDHATTSFELLNTDSPEEIKILVDRLEEKNTDRQVLVADIVKEIERRLLDAEELPDVIIEGSADWSSSVAGLVASKIVEKYQKPAFIYAIDNEKKTARGSCRSIHGYNLVGAMEGAGEFLIEFGGHKAASGFHLKLENCEKFSEYIQNDYKKFLIDGPPEKYLEIDCEIDIEEISAHLYKELEKLQPFGVGNEEPVFLAKSLRLSEKRDVGSGKNHAKLKLLGFFKEGTGVKTLPAMLFNSKNKFDDISAGDNIDVVFSLEENIWNGTSEIFLKVIDFAKKDEKVIIQM